MNSFPLTIWRFTDGKIGHEKQSQALIEGLAEHKEVCIIDIPADRSVFFLLIAWFTKKAFADKKLPNPDLIIGTGHKTHLPMLIARQKRGGKTIVVMTPSLPLKWFDLVIAPEHDFIGKQIPKNVIPSLIALASQIESKPNPTKGLILLGGESKNFIWNNEKIAQKVKEIVTSNPTINWKLSNSRRTPTSCLSLINSLCKQLDNIQSYDHNDLDSDWLSKQLKSSGHIWTSSDSASMIAETLMTSAEVHLISLTEKKRGNKFAYTLNKLKNMGVFNKKKDQKNIRDSLKPTTLGKDIIKKLNL